jgi:putative membrane protein
MSHPRLFGPACAAGLLSFCVAAGVSAQNTAPGTSNRNDAMRPPAAAKSQAPAGSTAMGSNNATAKATSASISGGDRRFMLTAAQDGMAEVQLGKLAAEKGASKEVKQFGQKMVDDHGKANDKLKQLATSKGVNLPTALDRGHQRDLEKMSKLSGAAFDREYMKHMVSDHKNDVGDFKAQANKAKDPDLKAFAASTLPTLEQHLTLAQSTEKVTNAKSGDATQTTTRKGMSKTGS